MRELDDIIRKGLSDWADRIPTEAARPAPVASTSTRSGPAVLSAAAAVLAIALGLAAVTSGGGAPDSGTAPAPVGSAPAPTSPLPSARSTPPLPPPTGAAADALRQDLLPIVQASYQRWEWPEGRDSTPLQLVNASLRELLAGTGPIQAVEIADNANMCAWGLELLADAGADRSTEQARRNLALHETGAESSLDPLLAAAQSEDLDALRQVMATRGCAQLPLG